MRWNASMNSTPTKLESCARPSMVVVPRVCQDIHERDLDSICKFRDDWTLGEEVEEAFPDAVRQRCDQDAEGRHFRREEHERERVAAA